MLSQTFEAGYGDYLWIPGEMSLFINTHYKI